MAECTVRQAGDTPPPTGWTRAADQVDQPLDRVRKKAGPTTRKGGRPGLAPPQRGHWVT
ncbi:hypothetical protein KCMC57_up38550 [Kitasatospora sp. CMC57]|uniref:Transposase n=1 Tax=Kitasatospora sp. CMC57 TaxID=3231513 RepID=A0AB33K6F9_9ACTN